MVMLTFSACDQKHDFGVNIVQKFKNYQFKLKFGI